MQVRAELSTEMICAPARRAARSLMFVSRKAFPMLSRLLAPAEDKVIFTPWGAPQHMTTLADGIQSVSTGSHGGRKLSAERNAQMRDYMRNEDGWYEEDSEWAKVAVVFPDAFGADVVTAYRTLRNWKPDAYERFTGRVLKPGDSYIRDQQTFRRDHANSLIVVSAYGAWASWVPQGARRRQPPSSASGYGSDCYYECNYVCLALHADVC